MKVCQICYTNESFITPCNCQNCVPCLINWFGIKNNETQTINFNCPNQHCSYNYSRQELQNICKYPLYEQQLSEILLKEYLKNQDIRPCPNGRCRNFGFIDLNSRCDQLLQCTSCSTKWLDISISSQAVQLEYGFSNMYFNIKDFIYCFLFTNECPQCGVQIQRNGGCQHMTCKACQHQFCWYCKFRWNGHMLRLCSFSYATKMGIFVYILMSLLQTLGLLNTVLFLFSLPFKWFSFVILANSIPFGFVVGVVYFCYGFSHLYCQWYKKGTLEVTISTVSLIIWYQLHSLIADIFDLSISIYISAVMWEGIIAVVIVCYLFRQQLTWIVFPISAMSLLYYFGLNGLCLLCWGLPIMKKQFANNKYLFQCAGYLLFTILNIFDLQEQIQQNKISYIFSLNLVYILYVEKSRIFDYIRF
ncbi:unnamed protein product (macronuclear) [Paramecium tetraurelia]|uniref:RING-type domain-containing protein n=1 Tax=Paramecium tetraurelia TaxID=5888 RepID=A0DR71_PARTE|nr:uncharacterized protein GSPATT00019255001 [Paramecium tetraurelia]CAK85538.1 unnamed protein product [Paramecium tetraurelia]|eukprot:XP_001452935.1 hypothetical protein (macronuclear) [Paramecium tetraurelia strain d4-2]